MIDIIVKKIVYWQIFLLIPYLRRPYKLKYSILTRMVTVLDVFSNYYRTNGSLLGYKPYIAKNVVILMI